MATATLLPEAASVTERPDLSESLYEVIDGIVLEKPLMGAYENSLASDLVVSLSLFARPLGIGRAWTEILFDLRPVVNRERRPDAAFVSAERWPLHRRVPRGSAWRFVPDLAIEVISPSNLASDMAAKVNEYFLVGVRRIWVLYPETGEIYAHDSPASIRKFGRGEVLTDEALLPGFRLDLDEFFGPPE